MNENFQNKTVLITGASGDIGAACAEAFFNRGANLILHSFHHPEKIDAFIVHHNKDNRIIGITCDATEEDQVGKQFDLLVNKFSLNNIDVLINCAGDLISRCPFDEMSWEYLEDVFEANVKSSFLFTKYSLPFLRSGSSIIFVSSMTARSGKGDRSSAYGLAKGAILSFSKCLANELGPRGIRVNCLTPGYIRGGFHDRYTDHNVELEHASRNPLGRVGEPGDVAAAAVFYAGESGGYISGTTLDICGADYMQ